MVKDYDLITMIVEYGKADPLIDAAFDAGAQGATIHPARGVGVRKAVTGDIDLGVDSDKEMVLVVTDSGITNKVYDAMVKAGKLDDWGRGFGYVQKITKPIGFLKED